jgi:hypothetical protein
MGTICAPLLDDLFLHAYEADFLQGLLKNKDRKLAQTFNFSIRYIYDVLSLKNSRFGDYLHHSYPNELEVNDTTDTQKSASYLDLHLEIDNGERLKTKLYLKGDDFTFQIVNFLSSVAIFQHHQHKEFIFHNSYVILELVPSTVIFWTEHSR